MGKSRRRPGEGTPQVGVNEPTLQMPPGLPAPGFAADSFGWLRRLLASAALDEHFEAAATWVVQTGCIQQDLDNDEHLQALCDHLSLKKFPATRLGKARDAFACALPCSQFDDDVQSISTAASVTGVKSVSIATATCAAGVTGVKSVGIAAATCDGVAHSIEGAEELGNGQAVLVEYAGLPYLARVQHHNPDNTVRVIYDEDGTYEDVQRKRITTYALADHPSAGVSSAKVSKSAKKRERKQARDAAYATSNEGLQPKTSQIKASNEGLQPKTAQTNSRSMCAANQRMPVDVIESTWTWSVTSEGCKDRAELFIPSTYVGWIIGKNGSTIKHIENKYLVTVQLISQTLSVYGKRERVKQAVAFINEVLWA